MNRSRHAVRFLVLVFLSFVSQVEAAPNWAVGRASSHPPGACYVGQMPFTPPADKQYDKIIAKGLPSKKAACNKAKELNTADPLDADKCFTYSTDSVVECRREGVSLP